MKLNIIENPTGIRGEDSKDSFSSVKSQFPTFMSSSGMSIYGQSMVSNDSYIIVAKVKGSSNDSLRVYLEIIDKKNLNTIRNFLLTSTNIPTSNMLPPLALKGDRLLIAMPVSHNTGTTTTVSEYSLSHLLALQDAIMPTPNPVKTARLDNYLGTVTNANGYVQFGEGDSVYVCTASNLIKVSLIDTYGIIVTPTWYKPINTYFTHVNGSISPSGLLFDDSGKLYFALTNSNQGLYLSNINPTTGALISQLFIPMTPGYSYPTASTWAKIGIIGQIDNDLILVDGSYVSRVSKATLSIIWKHFIYPKTPTGLSASLGLNLPYREMFIKVASGTVTSSTSWQSQKDYTLDLDTGTVKKVYPTITNNNSGYVYPELYYFGEGDTVYGGENNTSLMMYKERRYII